MQASGRMGGRMPASDWGGGECYKPRSLLADHPQGMLMLALLKDIGAGSHAPGRHWQQKKGNRTWQEQHCDGKLMMEPFKSTDF